jgi:hypothetical protein
MTYFVFPAYTKWDKILQMNSYKSMESQIMRFGRFDPYKALSLILFFEYLHELAPKMFVKANIEMWYCVC